MTSSPTTATPPSTPPFQHQHSSDSTVPVQGEDHPLNVYTHNNLEEHPPTSLPGLTQYPLNSVVHGDSSTIPGLTHYPLNSDLRVHMHGGAERFLPSSTFSGLTQYPPNLGTLTYTASGMPSSDEAYFVQQTTEELGGEMELNSYDPPGPNEEEAPVSLDPPIPQEKSDVFAGTSQAYSAPSSIQHHVHREGYFFRHPNALNREPALESLAMVNHDGEYQQKQDLPGRDGRY